MRTFIVLIIFMSCCFAAEPEPLPLPGNAQAAVDKFDAAKKKAEADAARVVGKERDKLIDELTKMKTAETKKGNLETAVALKDKLDALIKEQIGDVDLLGNQNAKPKPGFDVSKILKITWNWNGKELTFERNGEISGGHGGVWKVDGDKLIVPVGGFIHTFTFNADGNLDGVRSDGNKFMLTKIVRSKP